MGGEGGGGGGGGDQSFTFLVRNKKVGAIFKGGTNYDETMVKMWRGPNILSIFHSTHKENINKTRKTITPILDTKNVCVCVCVCVCVSKYFS